MDERTQAAYAAITEILKQVITLATALLGFQIAFVKDLSASVTTGKISAAWYLLFASIVLAMIVLLILAGDLGRGKHTPVYADIYIWYIRLLSGLAIVCFAVGLYITLDAGLDAFHAGKTEHQESAFHYPFYWAPWLAAPPVALPPPVPASSAAGRAPSHHATGAHRKNPHRTRV